MPFTCRQLKLADALAEVAEIFVISRKHAFLIYENKLEQGTSQCTTVFKTNKNSAGELILILLEGPFPGWSEALRHPGQGRRFAQLQGLCCYQPLLSCPQFHLMPDPSMGMEKRRDASPACRDPVV